MDDPAAELPVVCPALVIAGRSLSRELAAGPDANGRATLRPHANGGIAHGTMPAGGIHPGVIPGARPAHAGTVQKLRPATARKVNGQ